MMHSEDKLERKDIKNTKVIYIDMDGVLCDFESAYHLSKKEDPNRTYPQSKEGFFRSLVPIEHAIESVKWLDAQPEYSVFILTAPSIHNPHCYIEKRLWIEDHFGMEMVGRLIINGYKHLCQGDYLIDDCASGRGQDLFGGQLILFGPNNDTQFKNWKDVIQYFNKG